MCIMFIYKFQELSVRNIVDGLRIIDNGWVYEAHRLRSR